MATCALTCAEAKKIDLVDYLASLSHHPQKVRNNDYWYLSPLRDEKTASFKVDRRQNLWFDHGTGKGGNLIDFGITYFNCTVSELLKRLSDSNKPTLSFHQPISAGEVNFKQVQNKASFAGENKENTDGKIIIVNDRPLTSKTLLKYLEKRQIPPEIADTFCREIDFLLYGKKHTVIGFQNSAGGYELRSQNFKGSSSPKDLTFIDYGKDQVAVFEGFFSFLSFQTINQKQGRLLTNFLVLNSLSFFQKARDQMESHRYVHLFLDRDTPGKKHTEQALLWDKEKYLDRSPFYENCKDLNEWLIHHKATQRQSLRLGKHF